MNNRLIIADAHVHLYDCFDMERLLDLAFSNFQKEADKPIKGTPFSAFLCLAETKTENWFYRLSHPAERGPSQPRGMRQMGLSSDQRRLFSLCLLG